MIKYILLFGIIIFILMYNSDNNFKKSVTNFTEKCKLFIFKLIKDNNNFKNISLNYGDSQSILKFLQSKYNYDNILIPKNISYIVNKDKTFSINDIEIIGKKFINNTEMSTTHNISLNFIPLGNNTFISNQDLFGINGNFYLISDSVKSTDENVLINETDNSEEIIDITPKKEIIIEEPINNIVENNVDENHLHNNIQKDNLKNNDTVFLENDSVLSKVPDIIHLTSESEIEIDSIQETTEDINQNISLLV